jgi:hypothetical protein
MPLPDKTGVPGIVSAEVMTDIGSMMNQNAPDGLEDLRLSVPRYQ